MKVITWNCHMGFRKKYPYLLSFNPDLLIIPECEKPERISENFYHQVLWCGENDTKGLGVFSFNNLEIEINDIYNEKFKYVLPIKVTIPTSKKILNLIAIWSQDNLEYPERRYIGEVWNSLNYYKALLDQTTIIAGDFNWDLKIIYGEIT